MFSDLSYNHIEMTTNLLAHHFREKEESILIDAFIEMFQNGLSCIEVKIFDTQIETENINLYQSRINLKNKSPCRTYTFKRNDIVKLPAELQEIIKNRIKAV